MGLERVVHDVTVTNQYTDGIRLLFIFPFVNRYTTQQGRFFSHIICEQPCKVGMSRHGIGLIHQVFMKQVMNDKDEEYDLS
jgi:hypothetical protein